MRTAVARRRMRRVGIDGSARFRKRSRAVQPSRTLYRIRRIFSARSGENARAFYRFGRKAPGERRESA
jgi:hypothetical protein